ncbi:MAG: hypothetical protein KDA61_00795 [Planctomycetales bacterium]|nr:hypothetical protein [Planctomycetales bacterium]
MPALPLHPSMTLLLRMRYLAAWRKLRRTVGDPRKRWAVALTALMATLWAVNAAASIWLREQAAPRALEMMLAGGFSFYTLWHLLRVACFPPESPLEQPRRQRELLDMLPVTPRDIASFHLTNMGVVAGAKAAFAAVLLLPDVHLPLVAWLALWSALVVVELNRTLIEISVWSFGRKALLVFRVTTVAITVAAGAIVVSTPDVWSPLRAAGLEGRALEGASAGLQAARDAWWGESLCRIWSFWTTAIVAERWSWALLARIVASLTVVATLAWCVMRWHGRRIAAVARRELARPLPQHTAAKTSTGRRSSTLPWAPTSGGARAIFWRQARGAWRHRWGLVVAMAPPTALALSPLLAEGAASATFLAVAGALAFYTFLLLPTALKFDFRRDFDRMPLLKSLPISSTSLAIGQIATPVAVATLFQCFVLAVCQFVRPIDLAYPACAVGLFLLVNTMLFAIDNLLFLRSPHRMHQEGVAVLINTLLTFSIKGLMFAAASAFTLGCLHGSSRLSTALEAVGLTCSTALLFLILTLTGFATATFVAIKLLGRSFSRFDPSCHQM